jgi:phosphatidylserine/phosphatidylglycerophosphate/cardiolipin synthase-like enzyme
MFRALPVLAFSFFACTQAPSIQPDLTDDTHERGFGPADLVQVYFTEPGISKGDEQPISMDEALLGLLDGAKSSIDIAIYDLKEDSIIDALIRAHKRGVQVRMVGDADEAEDWGYLLIEEAGIQQSLRETSGIMHNKFIVVDARVVWTGSTNLTYNGLYRNNNDALLLDSIPLADEFIAEFNQMFNDEVFGAKKEDENTTNAVPFNDDKVEFYFSPQHDVVEVMQDLIGEADHSALFMVFSFTHETLTNALSDAQANGVEVAGLLDEGQARPWYSKDEALAQAGIPLYLDGNNNSEGFAGGKLHHKALIVDAGTASDPFVVTGSFNWSKSADTKNDENLVVIRDPAIVDQYKSRWCALRAQATVHEDYEGKDTTVCFAKDEISAQSMQP